MNKKEKDIDKFVQLNLEIFYNTAQSRYGQDDLGDEKAKKTLIIQKTKELLIYFFKIMK